MSLIQWTVVWISLCHCKKNMYLPCLLSLLPTTVDPHQLVNPLKESSEEFICNVKKKVLIVLKSRSLATDLLCLIRIGYPLSYSFMHFLLKVFFSQKSKVLVIATLVQFHLTYIFSLRSLLPFFTLQKRKN